MFGRKATLKWEGKEYELTVTMDVAVDVDESINILAASVELEKGGIPKMTMIAKMYSVLLVHAGAKVTDEDVYKKLMTLDDVSASSEIVNLTRNALALFFPKIDAPERPAHKKK